MEEIYKTYKVVLEKGGKERVVVESGFALGYYIKDTLKANNKKPSDEEVSQFIEDNLGDIDENLLKLFDEWKEEQEEETEK